MVQPSIVNGYNSTFRCTVDKSDPPVVELSVQLRPGPEDNWKIKTNGTEWIGVIITKSSNMTSNKFECSARNNVTTNSFPTYEVDPDGPYFIEGTNKTIWSEIKSGKQLGGEKEWYTYLMELLITKADISNTMDCSCT